MSSPELRLGINVPPAGCELILLYYEPRMNPGQGLGASLALQELHRIGDGLPVAPDPTAEVALCRLLCDLAEKRLLLAAHDASDGGLAVTIVEMLIENELGADIDLTELGDLRSDALLFGEVPGRAIVACLPELSNDVASRAKGQIAAVRLGRVDPENRSLRITRGGISLIELQANDLKRAHALSLPGLMES